METATVITVTIKSYFCDECNISFDVFHSKIDNINTHCHWCGKPVRLIKVGDTFIRIDGKWVKQ